MIDKCNKIKLMLKVSLAQSHKNHNQLPHQITILNTGLKERFNESDEINKVTMNMMNRVKDVPS